MNNSKLKIINKGYTITVDSYENDGDNHQSHSLTVDTMNDVKTIDSFLKLCEKIGNAYEDFEKGDLPKIEKFVKEHPDLLYFADQYLEDPYDHREIFLNVAYQLVGCSSDDYILRYPEKWTIVYSDKNVYLEEIKLT